MSGLITRGARGLHPGRLSLAVLVVIFVLGIPQAFAQDDESCQFCHGDPEMFDDAQAAARLVVDSETLAASIHGEIGLACVDCHQDLSDVEDFPHEETPAPVDCGVCHDDVQEEYAKSLHGYALARGNTRAPTCASCHSGHDIRPATDPESRTHRSHLAEVCAQCHGTAGMLTSEWVKRPLSVKTWQGSVHGATSNGNGSTPTCADCHGVHDMRGVADPSSPINAENVSKTCGQCHDDVATRYDASIHGMALAAGISDSPTCTDCHGEHQILSPDDPDAPTSPMHLAHDTCGRCHDDPKIIAKYGLSGATVGSYSDSYHGWATSQGYKASATCVSCHTAHDVLPEAHPDSTVNPANVVETCRNCHPRADVGFAESYAHEKASITANPISLFLRNFYWVLITVVIGGMLFHNFVILNYFSTERRRADNKAGYVVRMDVSQIVQHMFLIVTFCGLVVTGFVLRFPNSWWAVALGKMGMTEQWRAWLHRGFAIGMVVTAIAHLIHTVFTASGRSAMRAMLPRYSDVGEFAQNMKFHIWRSENPPRFGRFDYTHKAEYWALVWGTGLMAATGLVLWFPAIAVRIFPTWIAIVSQTLHYYEAWLAMLAILVWHMFFVVLHPERYPMDWSWINGKMSRRDVRHHHRRWYDEMGEERRLRVLTARGPESKSAQPSALKARGEE